MLHLLLNPVFVQRSVQWSKIEGRCTSRPSTFDHSNRSSCSSFSTKIRTNLNKFNNSITNSNSEEAIKTFGDVNSIMAKAVKKGILKKQYMSRKLSSLSNQIKKN